MTSLRRGDADLHDENGEHRSTSPHTSGAAIARYERRIRAHLAEHAAQPGEGDSCPQCPDTLTSDGGEPARCLSCGWPG